MKKSIVLILSIVLLIVLVGCNGDFDLFSAFRMEAFDSSGVSGYDIVDEDAGGIGEVLPADRGAIDI